MTPTASINQFYQHIIDKKADLIGASYIQTKELYVILEGPRLSNRGFENIFKGWKDFCNSGLSLLSIDWIEGPYEDVAREMAWVGGVIRLKVEVNEKVFEQVFRSSFVLRKKENLWKIKHEHVSAALEDPYGIGDWLKQN